MYKNSNLDCITLFCTGSLILCKCVFNVIKCINIFRSFIRYIRIYINGIAWEWKIVLIIIIMRYIYILYIKFHDNTNEFVNIIKIGVKRKGNKILKRGSDYI